MNDPEQGLAPAVAAGRPPRHRMSTRILLVARHGQATKGPDHVWTPEDPLTDLGHRQAADLAAHVGSLRRPPTRIVASPFLRAQQTAAPCAEALGLPIETDPRLAEFASTLPSPWTLAETDELMPYDDIWHPGDAGWDGETIGSFFERTGAAAEDHARADEVALVVCHGGTTMGIIRWAMMIPPREPDAFDLFIANASLTEIRTRVDRHGRERRHLRRVGDVRYLSEVTGI